MSAAQGNVRRQQTQNVQGNWKVFRWYNFMGGMNQAMNPFQMSDSDFLYLLNVSKEEVGTLQKDGGYSRWDADDSGDGQVDLLYDYITMDGTHTLLKVVNGDLRKSTGSGWSNVSTSEFTADKKCSAVNFLDRCYIANESDSLRYASSSSVTTIEDDNTYDIGDDTTRFDVTNPSGDTMRYTYDGTGTDPNIDDNMSVGDEVVVSGTNMAAANEDTFTVTGVSTNYFEVTNASGSAETDKTIGSGYIRIKPEIIGKYLELFGQALYLGGIEDNSHMANEVVYTKTATHQFFADGESYKDSRYKLRLDGEVTGLKVFRGLLYIFTTEAVWYHNPSTLETKPFYKHGTTSHFSVTELWGNLVWVDRAGIHLFSGEGRPTNIVRPLQNENIGAVWDKITGSSWDDIRSVAYGDNLYVYVGDLSGALPGDTTALDDVVLVYNYQQDSWHMLDNHKVAFWATFTNSSGVEKLLFGGNDDRNVYERDDSYSHDGTAIDMVARTKYYSMTVPEFNKVYGDLYVVYRPQNEASKYIDVSTAINGTNNYIEKVSDTTASKLSLNGDTTENYDVKRVTLNNTDGRSISYEFANSDDEINVVLLGFTQQFRVDRPNLNLSTS
jgi:hypothetical protein